MLRAKLTLVALGTCAIGAAAVSADVAPAASKRQQQLAFEVGAGPSAANYVSRGRGYSVFLSPTEATLALSRPTDDTARILRFGLVGASQSAAGAPSELLPGKTNYFRGASPTAWRPAVSNWGRVTYRDVYPGVDVTYYGKDGQLEYDFVVAPKSDPARIRLGVSGADTVKVTPEGLALTLGARTIVQRQPVVYQNSASGRQPVDGEYVVYADGNVGFKLGAYDSERPLVIDPVIISYSTYLGGSDDDHAVGVASDPDGNAYVVGFTVSGNFPQTGTTTVFDRDVVVVKFNALGVVEYSTIFGGTTGAGRDEGNAIAVEPNTREAYVTGYTASLDFPITGATAIQTAQAGNRDAFLVKLDSSGGIAYSTFLGGANEDRGQGVAIVPGTGLAYVAGFTASPFPTAGSTPVQTTTGGGFDAFVTIVDTNQSGAAGLVYSTYLGGSGTDVAYGVAIEPTSGDAVVTGYTSSSNFPTASAAQGTFGGGTDGFVTRLSTTGFVYSTYAGGLLGEELRGVAVDPSGNAYVTGRSYSFNFPTVNPLQPTKNGAGSWDAVVVKLDPAGSVVYATDIGGSGNDYGWAIATDATGAAYVVGQTGSPDFPKVDSTATFAGGTWDAFVLKLNPQGSALLYSAYVGGSGIDYAFGVSYSPAAGALVAGQTTSTDFPTVNAATATYQGGANDMFLTAIAPPTIIVTAPPAGATWLVGTTKTIAWDHNLGASSTVKIEINRDYPGGSWEELAAAAPNTANSSSFDWLVTGPTTPNARVRVSWNDDLTVTGESAGDFAIAVPSITVTAPNTAVKWAFGSTQQITWSHNLGAGETVKIEGSRNNGISWTTLQAAAPNTTDTTGVYSWVVTPTPSNNALIRVTWNTLTSVTDTSDVPFSLAAGSIAIAAPLTGAKWGVGSIQKIQWAHNLGTAETVDIDLSTDGGANFSSIATSVANESATTGSYLWTVTNAATTTAKIRVKWHAQPTTAGVSGNFTIGVGTIAVAQPSASTNWGIGSTHAITWTSNIGATATAKIEVSRDSGGTWSLITASAPNTGIYIWPVTGPVAPSGTGRVRVTWNEGSAVGTSGAFTIANPIVSVSNPNTAGLSFAVGSSLTLAWLHNLGTLETVKVEINRNYDVDPVNAWELISASAINAAVTQGQLAWVVTGPATTTARIRVTWNNPAATSDVSNFNFSITP